MRPICAFTPESAESGNRSEIVTSKEQLVALSRKEVPEQANHMDEKLAVVPTTAEAFALELYQEHLEEIAFLLNQCKSLFHDPEIDWPEVQDFERRLEAHLDAVEIGGPIALECTKRILSDEDEDNILAAAYTLASVCVGTDDKNLEGVDLVIGCILACDEDSYRPYVNALKHGHSPLIPSKIEQLLNSEQHGLQAMAAEILGYRREGDPQKIAELLRTHDPRLRAAAATSLAQFGCRDALPLLEQLISNTSDPYWEKLLLATLCLGSVTALNRARTACQSESTVTENLPIYIALAGNKTDQSLLVSTLSNETARKSAIEGLGILGDVTAIPSLIEELKKENNDLNLAAASALELITGAGLVEKHLVIEEEWLEEPIEEDEASIGSEYDEDEELEDFLQPELVEIEGPNTSWEIWSEWWQSNRNRFDSTQCWRIGKPFTLGSCIEDMANPKRKYDERQRAYLELVVRSKNHIPFEADWFVPKQQAAIAKWKKWWELNKKKMAAIVRRTWIDTI